MLSGGYIKYDSANKGIAVAMQFSIYCSQPNAYKLKAEGRRIDMDEITMVYYITWIIFLCLSMLQLVGDMVKEWHKYIRSSRHKKRNKRK